MIGNGDILTPEDVIRMKEQTNCDAFMIGRGARGNPWIFHELKTYFETGEIPPRPDKQQVKETMLRHARLMIDFKGSLQGFMRCGSMLPGIRQVCMILPDSGI